MQASDFNTSTHLDFNPVPELLYHYTTAEALAAILHSKAFRFSDLSKTNDPRETAMLRLAIQRRTENRSDLAPAEFTRRIRAGVKVACMTVDRDPLPSIAYEDGQGYLHRGFARPRNWSQYGDHHRGACLLFARDPFVAAAEAEAAAQGLTLEHGSVAYHDRQTNARADGTLLDLSSEEFDADPDALAVSIRRKWSKELFFTKFVDWASECEYRLAVYELPPNAEFHLPIKDTLAGILLGADYPPVERAVVRERLRLAGIPEVWLGKMDWDDNLPSWGDDLTSWEQMGGKP